MTAGALLDVARGDTRSPVSRNVSRRAKCATGRVERGVVSDGMPYLGPSCAPAVARLQGAIDN
jgi:hypothetical protein